MHPEIARRVIIKYGRKSDVVFDPFMGSGGVLLEAILNGHNAVGIDINPLAVLLSKVKTTPIRRGLSQKLDEILTRSHRDSISKKYHSDCVPVEYDVKNWFQKRVLNDLTILKYHINNIQSNNISDFFKICFSLAMRKSSYQRNGAWKTHRMSYEDRDMFRPKPFEIFADICKSNISKMKNLAEADPQGVAYPVLGDSKDIGTSFRKLKNALSDGKANLMITSPPYGDHKTTVAYGQFSRHSGHWLDLPEEKVTHVDRNGLGGRTHNNMDDLGSDTLNKTLDAIHRNDLRLTKNKTPCRDRETYAFFKDLDDCMEQISNNMVRGKSYACFVVANRTVRRVVVPTDFIVQELGKKYGFVREEIIYREIPNKAMPSKNAPENIINDTGNTMTKETVIIMRR